MELTAYERVQKAREKERPGIRDYIEVIFDDFLELKGDRLGREDASILCGIADFRGIPVTVIGHRKGRTTEENIAYNFGMGSPEGYRKAMRMMRQAEKFHRPVITLIDTPGAYPGIDAENHGQAAAIAESLALMSGLRVPTIAVITGEGSSGGALALAVSDRVWMLENAVYSILSPEGFASILWKDAGRAKEACSLMHLTAQELFEEKFIDRVIPENEDMMSNLGDLLHREVTSLMKVKTDKLLRKRYEKYRKIGTVIKYEESTASDSSRTGTSEDDIDECGL